MKTKRIKKSDLAKGSVSIMLAVLMIPVYTFAGVVVDGTRVLSAGQMTSGAVDLTMNAALASYDDVLKSVYGLFAMSQNEEELSDNLYSFFNQTISASDIEDDSDDYISQIAEFFSDSGKSDFDNLIRLSTESFDASLVENAVLSNPVVMKNQIVEYMKYSGPLSIGRGLITKLGVFKDFKKQNKAVDTKVKYEESLGDIQDLCEKVFYNVSDYNSYLNESSISDINRTTSDIQRACEYYRSASHSLVLCSSSSLEIPETPDTTELNKEIKRSARENDRSKIDETSIRIQTYIPYTKDENGNITNDESDFITKILDAGALESNETGYVFNMHCLLHCEYLSFIQLNILYKKYYDELSDEEKQSYKDEYDLFSRYSGIIDSQINKARQIHSGWKENADNDLINAQSIFDEKRANVSKLIDYLEKTSNALDKLKDKVDDAEVKGRTWSDAISDLSDGEVKSSMQGEFENSAGSLNKDDINEFFDSINADITGIKRLDEYLSEFIFNTDQRDFYICNDTDAADSAEILFSECLSRPDGNVPGDYNQAGDELNFYRYLADMCKKKDEEESQTEGFMESMNSSGSSLNISEPDISQAYSSDISSMIDQEKLDSIFNSSLYEESEDEYNVSDSKSSDEDDMLENQKNILASTSDFLQNLGELGGAAVGEGIDDLYLTEYITEMFSCYTSDKQATANGVQGFVPEMLSGVSMSPDNNVFYKSEVEYILWGSNEMKKNHQYTNALLFGMRFLLNNIYAFTDSQIKAATLAAATAIAGWTGFGIPIVKTVLIMSLALAESVIDVNKLLDGEAVPVYKSSHTWNMKPSGLINALRNNGEGIAKMAAEKVGEKVDDIFKKIDDIAEDKTDELTDTIHDFVDDMTDQAVDAAVNAVTGKLQDAAMSVLDSTDATITQEKISQILLEKLDLSDTGEEDIECLASRYMKEFAADKIEEISGVIYSSYSDISGKAKNKISDVRNAVSQNISETVEPLRGMVNDKIDECSEKLKEQVSKGIEKAGASAKQYTEDMVGKFVNGTSTALTERINAGSENTVLFGGNNKSTSGKAFTLTYKEYLKLFIMLSSMSEEKENSMLSRIASLIHINMESGMNDIVINNEGIEKPENFDITNAFTMIRIDAEVKMKLWFTSVFIPDYNMTPDGNTSYTYDYSEFASKEKNISVHSVMSY